jgi:hypothetical protein
VPPVALVTPGSAKVQDSGHHLAVSRPETLWQAPDTVIWAALHYLWMPGAVWGACGVAHAVAGSTVPLTRTPHRTGHTDGHLPDTAAEPGAGYPGCMEAPHAPQAPTTIPLGCSEVQAHWH